MSQCNEHKYVSFCSFTLRQVVVLIGGRPLTFNTGSCVKPASRTMSVKTDSGGAIIEESYPDPGAVCSTASLLSNVSALLMAWRPGAQGELTAPSAASAVSSTVLVLVGE
jgi:hypothetical protein